MSQSTQPQRLPDDGGGAAISDFSFRGGTRVTERCLSGQVVVFIFNVRYNKSRVACPWWAGVTDSTYEKSTCRGKGDNEWLISLNSLHNKLYSDDIIQASRLLSVDGATFTSISSFLNLTQLDWHWNIISIAMFAHAVNVRWFALTFATAARPPELAYASLLTVTSCFVWL